MSDRYEIIHELGRDENTIVYRARDTVLACEVVLKRLAGDAAGNEDLKKQLINEARALARVRSPHVVQVLAVGEDSDGFYLATEGADGVTLRERLGRSGTLEFEPALRMVRELATGLKAVHRAQLVHGSVSPEDVILRDDGSACLGGFQLARKSDGAPSFQTSIGQRTTVWKDAQKDSPVAPEIALGGMPDARTDVFALGSLMVESMSGKRPFPANTPTGVDVALLRRARPDLPSWIDSVLEKALSLDPGERYPSVTEFEQALDPDAGAESATAGASGSSNRTWALAAAGLLVAGTLGYRQLNQPAPALQRGIAVAGPAEDVTEYSPGYANSYALIVGVNRYKDVGAWQSLKLARPDAEAIYKHLVEEEGFPEENVTFLQDGAATRDAIMRALAVDLARAQPEDRVVFFFAGHGTQATRAGSTDIGYGRLVPSDASDVTGFITMSEVKEFARTSRAKHFLMLFDCCFSGWAAARGGIDTQNLEMATTRRSIQILTAGAPNQPVSDALAGSNHSPFTHFMLEGMRGAADTSGLGFVTASDLGNYVRKNVVRADTGQVPLWTTFEGTGDFVFEPREHR